MGKRKHKIDGIGETTPGYSNKKRILHSDSDEEPGSDDATDENDSDFSDSHIKSEDESDEKDFYIFPIRNTSDEDTDEKGAVYTSSDNSLDNSDSYPDASSGSTTDAAEDVAIRYLDKNKF
ncbi:hypothetical protein CDL15_Pgr023901 [Punica granatum]|uniref:Uncharacterized protein n=1 Tax=Punica granatum TaxID=22663 RepID=A0A218XV68_PUNGR|nr:hypothetical protein CDL15_Pgr023901 [Punica granatum]PKI52633.1 hypothetical protein CRG98_026973 [Punica granatum]